MTSSWISWSCSSTVATPASSRPVNALTSEASVMAAIRWLTPVGSISLIFATTSAGVPEKESLSASSGLVSSMPRARSPPPIASMIGLRLSGSTPFRSWTC